MGYTYTYIRYTAAWSSFPSIVPCGIRYLRFRTRTSLLWPTFYLYLCVPYHSYKRRSRKPVLNNIFPNNSRYRRMYVLYSAFAMLKKSGLLNFIVVTLRSPSYNWCRISHSFLFRNPYFKRKCMEHFPRWLYTIYLIAWSIIFIKCVCHAYQSNLLWWGSDKVFRFGDQLTLQTCAI